MLQKKYIGIVLLLLVAVSASAQKAERDYIRKGNRFFKDSVYVDAEVNYRKALEVNPKSTVSMFNLGYIDPAEQAAGSDGAICGSYQDRKGQIELSTDLS